MMYLLLVDHNLISSSDLKEMIEQAPAGTDIVNCYSQDTLLKIADKISPDIVIIDFDLVKGDLASLFDNLRSKSKDAYVMALISPEYYDTLYNAIELGGLDDYMVKPIQKEDLFARVKIATKKKKRPDIVGDEPASVEADQKGEVERDQEFDDIRFDEKPEPEQQEPDLEQIEDDKEFTSEDQDKDILHYQGITEEDLLDTEEEGQASLEDLPGGSSSSEEAIPEEFDLGTGPVENGDEPGETEESFDDFELFDDQDKGETFAEKDEPESGSGYDFDAILPGSEEQDHDSDLLDEELTPTGTQAPEPDLFDDLSAEDQQSQQDDGEDLLKLFEDVDSIFDNKEASPDLSKEEATPGHEREPMEDRTVSDSEYAQDVVRPADEFLGKSRPAESEQPTPPLAEDKKFFDDLFDDEPGKEQSSKAADDPARHTSPIETSQARDSDDAYQRDYPDFSEDSLEDDEREDLYPRGPQLSREEIRRRSDLPGRSADEFLFGEDFDTDQEAKTDHDSDQPGLSEPDSEDLFAEDDREEREEWSRSKKQNQQRSRFRNFLSIFGNILFVVLLLVMAGLSFFLIQSRVTGGVPQVAGYQMYIVLSGSMSPEFDTGSLAFVREVEPAELVVGDIITFRSPNDPDSLTTHRIVEVQREDGLSFITRGDANNVNDPNPVPAENVVGMVTGTVPYVGYLLNFVQTTQGLILLIFVPGVLIIVFELNKIMKYLTQGENGSKRKKDNAHNRLAEGEQ